jgi:hypothetical protein
MDVKNQSEVNPIEQKHGAQVSPELNKTNQKADLKNILASNKDLDPTVADAIRKQIALMESGEVSPVPRELGSHGVSENGADLGTVKSRKVLVDLLNGAEGGDVISTSLKADQAGAGYDVMNDLIEKAKREAKNNQN